MIRKTTHNICDDDKHIRNKSPCVQVRGLQTLPNRLLLIPQRDAKTEALIKIYKARLVCWDFTPVKSIDGPATAPAKSALHFAVLQERST